MLTPIKPLKEIIKIPYYWHRVQRNRLTSGFSAHTVNNLEMFLMVLQHSLSRKPNIPALHIGYCGWINDGRFIK